LLLKYSKRKGFAEEESPQKEKIEKLKLIVDNFTEVVREKEEFVLQVGLRTIEARMTSLCRELDLLRDKVIKQDAYISEKSREFNTIVGRLEQAVQHSQHNDVTLSELNDRFRIMSDTLKQLEKQNQVLHTVIEEKEKTLTSAISKDNEFKEFKKYVIESMGKFEEFITDHQNAVANKVQQTESRCFYVFI
jgi:methyl-accepting chemotaxis protein